MGREKLFQLDFGGNRDSWIVSRTDWGKVKQLVDESPGLLSAPAKAVGADQGDVLMSLYTVKRSAVPTVEDVSFRGKSGRVATYRMATIAYVMGFVHRRNGNSGIKS